MKKLIFTPGPVMMSKKIKKIGQKQPNYFRNNEFSQILLDCQDMLLNIANAPKNSKVIFLGGSGTLGLEASVLNFLDMQKKATVLNGGDFGARFAEICNKNNLHFDEIKLQKNEPLNFSKINTNIDIFFTNAHETTIGRLYDIEKIGKFCTQNDILLIVDAISAFIGDKIDMKSQNIDVLIISSNKGLALPPGLVMIILSPKAINNLVKTKSLYCDFALYLENIKRGQTPFTPPILIIYQLQARLKQIQKMQIRKCNKKVEKLANYFRANIKNLPFEFYSTDMANSMSALVLTNGEKAYKFIEKFEKKYNIVLTPSGGGLKDTLVRVAHIGELRKKDFDYLIFCLEDYFKEKK